MRFREMMRADILNAAQGILQQGGFSALSMRTLAEAVGVRAPTLYDYFESKEDVLNAIFLDAVGTLRQYFLDNMAAAEPGVPRLISMGMAYRNFAIESPVLFRLIFGRVDASYIPGQEQMGKAKELFDALRAEVVTAIDLGQITAADPDAIAVTLWANVHGLSSLQLDGHMAKCTTMSADEVVQFSVSALFYGLVPRSERPSVNIPIQPTQDTAIAVGE
jgi:AcrR family transcriptional regulator